LLPQLYNCAICYDVSAVAGFLTSNPDTDLRAVQYSSDDLVTFWINLLVPSSGRRSSLVDKHGRQSMGCGIPTRLYGVMQHVTVILKHRIVL
jgi:hypothetical protein